MSRWGQAWSLLGLTWFQFTQGRLCLKVANLRDFFFRKTSVLIRVHPVNCQSMSSLRRASCSWTSTTSGNTTLSCWRSNSLLTPRSFHRSVYLYTCVLLHSRLWGCESLAVSITKFSLQYLDVVQWVQGSLEHICRNKLPFTLAHTYRQCGVLTSRHMHVFGRWEEAGKPVENPHRHAN